MNCLSIVIWRPINQVSELIYRHVESTCYEFEVLITKISVWPTTGVRPSDIVSQPGRQGLGLWGSGSNCGLVQQKPGEIRLQVKKKKKHSSGQHWMCLSFTFRGILSMMLLFLLFQPKSPSLPVLMRANADFQLKNGSPQQAAKMLEELRK